LENVVDYNGKKDERVDVDDVMVKEIMVEVIG